MAVLVWWLLLEALGLVALPLLFPLFGRASAHGYPFAKIAGLLLLTYVAWLLGFVGAVRHRAEDRRWSAGSRSRRRSAWVQRAALAAWLRDGGWAQVVRADGLWTLGFLFFVLQRWMAPDIFGAEKYMDFAFINGLLRADAMPPYDPWMSGDTINYYYFGYLMFANLLRLAPMPDTIGYNLCVATVGGLAFSQTAWVVLAITGRWGLGVLGGAMSAVPRQPRRRLAVPREGHAARDGLLALVARRRQGRHDQRVPVLLDHPRRPAPALHGAAGRHPAARRAARRAPLPVAPRGRAHQSRGARWCRGRVVTFLLAAMVAISNWELPMGVLVVALLAGRAIPLTPLFSRDAAAPRAAAGRSC